LDAYDEYLDAVRVEGTIRADSFEEAREEEKKNMALKVLAKRISVQDASELTGLSAEVIESLKKDGQSE
jgi:hypothetical protein